MDSNKNLYLYSSTCPNSPSPVRDFYRGKNIFISGATGFVGKCVLEKLIRTTEPGTIYVLIRPKKGQTPQARLEQILSSNIFSATKGAGDLVKNGKVRAVEGDLLEPALGISEADRAELVDRVNVVFHSAASVKFNDPIKKATEYNLAGTSKMLDLCTDMNHLDMLVHVSTAYAFCEHSVCEERLYPVDHSPVKFLNWMNTLTEEEADRETKRLLGPRPNTYTFTKGLTEHLVVDRCTSARIPFAIGRPSIVTSSLKEPTEGWIDSVNGPTGVSVLCSLGICRTGLVGIDMKMDMVPVDVVANSLIAIGWYQASEGAKAAPAREPVYNITTGELNPITWGEYFDMGKICAIKTPSSKILRPIATVPHNPSKLRVELVRFFSEFLFAFFIDLLLGLLGHKKFMVRIIRKIHEGFEHMDYFSSREWTFVTDNLMRVRDAMSAEDKLTFDFNIRAIDWFKYIERSMLGVRRTILKEDDSTIPAAKRRYKRLVFCYRVVQFGLVALLFWYFVRPSWVGCLLAASSANLFYSQTVGECDVWAMCSR